MQAPSPQPSATQNGETNANPGAVRLIALGVLIGLVIAGLIFLLVRKPDPAPIVLHAPPTPAPTATPLPTPTPSPLTVFVSGGVTKPGVYRLEWDARVGDALAAAGGLQEGVDGALVNQAEQLFDGAQVHVPLAQENSPAVGSQNGPPPGLSGTTAASAPSGGAGNGLINLNTASPDELMNLPGIGPSKADAIIANRPYDAVDDLDRVPGFGSKTIDQLRELVTTH